MARMKAMNIVSEKLHVNKLDADVGGKYFKKMSLI